MKVLGVVSSVPDEKNKELNAKGAKDAKNTKRFNHDGHEENEGF